MTNETKFYRRATVSHIEAITGLSKAHPNVELVSFEKKQADAAEAKLASANEGELIYVATVRVAEFPPSDKGGEEDAPPAEEKSEPEAPEEPKEEKPEEDAAPEFGSDADGAGAPGEEKEKKLSPEEETVHLLHQILDAIKGGGALGGPDAGLGGPDLPDIGAPPAGGGLPPAGGLGGKPPLPPPVPQKAPMGAGAFAHVVAGQKEFTFRRGDAHEVNNAGLITEATNLVPGFRVAKIDRRSEPGAAHVLMARSEG